MEKDAGELEREEERSGAERHDTAGSIGVVD
jgi:hypothetical protein